jgi:hypothetical protein
MSTILGGVFFAAGFATCWLCKDKIIACVTGTERFIKLLERKAAALKAVR